MSITTIKASKLNISLILDLALAALTLELPLRTLPISKMDVQGLLLG
jgi:hypothetical protein